jgi:hypothetical protein
MIPLGKQKWMVGRQPSPQKDKVAGGLCFPCSTLAYEVKNLLIISKDLGEEERLKTKGTEGNQWCQGAENHELVSPEIWSSQVKWV